MPNVGLGSWHGLFILVQQLLHCMAIGFISASFRRDRSGGRNRRMQMGLGFASSSTAKCRQTLVVAQFFQYAGGLAFSGGERPPAAARRAGRQFQSLPSAPSLFCRGLLQRAAFGSTVFAVGLQLALPLIAILLMTNLALGILTRSAPQLNIFAIRLFRSRWAWDDRAGHHPAYFAPQTGAHDPERARSQHDGDTDPAAVGKRRAVSGERAGLPLLAHYLPLTKIPRTRDCRAGRRPGPDRTPRRSCSPD